MESSGPSTHTNAPMIDEALTFLFLHSKDMIFRAIEQLGEGIGRLAQGVTVLEIQQTLMNAEPPVPLTVSQIQTILERTPHYRRGSDRYALTFHPDVEQVKPILVSAIKILKQLRARQPSSAVPADEFLTVVNSDMRKSHKRRVSMSKLLFALGEDDTIVLQRDETGKKSFWLQELTTELMQQIIDRELASDPLQSKISGVLSQPLSLPRFPSGQGGVVSSVRNGAGMDSNASSISGAAGSHASGYVSSGVSSSGTHAALSGSSLLGLVLRMGNPQSQATARSSDQSRSVLEDEDGSSLLSQDGCGVTIADRAIKARAIARKAYAFVHSRLNEDIGDLAANGSLDISFSDVIPVDCNPHVIVDAVKAIRAELRLKENLQTEIHEGFLRIRL
eukprot:ANDGO_04249.mRNA.1 hypothetical protein